MADDGQSDQESCGSALEHDDGEAPDNHAPDDRHAETVAPRVVIESQRRKRGVARIDSHPFDSGKQQDWPDEIETECGRDERRQRRTRRGALGAEGHCKVTNEHGAPILSESPYNAAIPGGTDMTKTATRRRSAMRSSPSSSRSWCWSSRRPKAPTGTR